jgi:hypothetical protein
MNGGGNTGTSGPTNGIAGAGVNGPSNGSTTNGSTNGPTNGSTNNGPLVESGRRRNVLHARVLEKWKEMGRPVYETSDGEYILSYKELSRQGKPYGYEFLIMSPYTPFFEIKTGSEASEKDAYLAAENKHKIETDPGSEKFAPWTYRNRDDYQDLLFTATKPRKQAKYGTRGRTGDTQCAVVWKNGKMPDSNKLLSPTGVAPAPQSQFISLKARVEEMETKQNSVFQSFTEQVSRLEKQQSSVMEMFENSQKVLTQQQEMQAKQAQLLAEMMKKMGLS